ncbi:MAG: hypothetical protein JST39_07515, partial [Bacteroidetes bacterium]|nr:hypothetical protein [Bacteroidota bacterium]
RPIGYSFFLRGVHALSASETLVVTLQYLLIQLGILHLFFTVWWLYKPGRWARRGLFLVLFCNPLVPYLANFISSDALFTALSLYWFIQLLWMISRPRSYQLVLLAALLYALLQTRLVGLYYLAPTVLALLLSGRRLMDKLAGAALLMVVTFFVYRSVRSETRAVTGTAVFSAFGGWQWANNSLHMYCHVKTDRQAMPEEYQALDSFVQRYFDTACAHTGNTVTTDYMWNPQMPLRQYMWYHMYTYKIPTRFQAWTAVGPLYSNYGIYLAKQHPGAFARYYLLPNTATYFMPAIEVMRRYNGGADTIEAIARDWFAYSSPEVHCIPTRIQPALISPFPALFAVLNIIFIAGLGWFLWVKGFRRATPLFGVSVLLTACWALANAGFSILSTPYCLRYQVFPFLLLSCFSLLLFDWLLRQRRQNSTQG